MRALCSVTLKQHIIRYVNRVEQQYTEISHYSDCELFLLNAACLADKHWFPIA
jgi:hypothetical protein